MSALQKSRWLYVPAAIAAIALLCASPAKAQIDITEAISLSATGSLGYGYTATYGNAIPSGHNTGLYGNARFNGYYFHPNFLSFEFNPYYARNSASAESQILNTGKGFGGNMSFFGGSRFPGSISYGRGYGNTSEFRVGGVSTFAGGASSNENFGITWSALFPDKPTLNVSYSSADSGAELTEDIKSSNSSKALNINSSYSLAGFDLRGNFLRNTYSFTSPASLSFTEVTATGAINTLGATATHALPLNGYLSLGWSRSHSSSSYGTDYNTSNYVASTTFSPWHRLSISQNLTYVTNLSAAFSRDVLGDSPFAVSDSESSGLFNSASATFNVGWGFGLTGRINHRNQDLAGRHYEDLQYGGNLTFNRSARFLGALYFNVGLVDTASKRGNEGLGLNTTVGLHKKIRGWETSADFNYAHNVQTLISTINTSNFNYGGSVRRRVTEDLRIGTTYRGSHSGMVVRDGNVNKADSFSGSVNWRTYTLTSTYSTSSGTAVLSATGELTPVPLGSVLVPEAVLFDATSITLAGSTVVGRRFNLVAGFSSFESNSQRRDASRHDVGERYLIRGEYRLRKFMFGTGFQRSNQALSSIPGGPKVVNSYYFNVSRWFDIF